MAYGCCGLESVVYVHWADDVDVRCGVAPLAASFLGLMHMHSTQMA
jgi:hypothetical protein